MVPLLSSTPAVAGVLLVSGSSCSTAPPSTPTMSWRPPFTRPLRKVRIVHEHTWRCKGAICEGRFSSCAFFLRQVTESAWSCCCHTVLTSIWSCQQWARRCILPAWPRLQHVWACCCAQVMWSANVKNMRKTKSYCRIAWKMYSLKNKKNKNHR